MHAQSVGWQEPRICHVADSSGHSSGQSGTSHASELQGFPAGTLRMRLLKRRTVTTLMRYEAISHSLGFQLGSAVTFRSRLLTSTGAVS
jgi:hypothetical protein